MPVSVNLYAAWDVSPRIRLTMLIHDERQQPQSGTAVCVGPHGFRGQTKIDLSKCCLHHVAGELTAASGPTQLAGNVNHLGDVDWTVRVPDLLHRISRDH